MENAAEALKMAGSVLLLILALSIVVLAFSNARQAIDNILAYSDREKYMIDNDEYYYLPTVGNTNLSRTVGLETIIPTIYRVFNENFKIEFNFGNTDSYYLYKDRDGNPIKTLDMSIIDNFSSDNKEKYIFLEAVLYHKYNRIK